MERYLDLANYIVDRHIVDLSSLPAYSKILQAAREAKTSSLGSIPLGAQRFWLFSQDVSSSE